MTEWLSDNWPSVVAAALAIHAAAVAVVNLTTPKDDEFVSKVYGWVEKFAGIFTKKAKE
jgi:hypothetical protein